MDLDWILVLIYVFIYVYPGKNKKKEKPLPPPPPVGPWIYKLHLAENGIDDLGTNGRPTLLTFIQTLAQYVTLVFWIFANLDFSPDFNRDTINHKYGVWGHRMCRFFIILRSTTLCRKFKNSGSCAAPLQCFIFRNNVTNCYGHGIEVAHLRFSQSLAVDVCFLDSVWINHPEWSLAVCSFTGAPSPQGQKGQLPLLPCTRAARGEKSP